MSTRPHACVFLLATLAGGVTAVTLLNLSDSLSLSMQKTVERMPFPTLIGISVKIR